MAAILTQKSTNVRLQMRVKLALIRTTFRTLDPLAPALAARLGASLWCTPPRPRHRPPGAPDLPPGTRFTVPVPGFRSPVVAETWGSGPTAYLLHGWGGWRGQLTPLVAPLVAAGHRVVAMDGPGHGDAGPGRLGGRRTTLVEIAEALAAVVAVAGPAHAVVAHSGGAAATGLAVREGLTADRLVFLAPMADPMAYFGAFMDTIGAGPRTRPRLRQRLRALVDRPLDQFNLPGWAARAGDLPPLLVIHDRKDREVRHADGHALAASWPGAILHTTEGLGHRRILSNPDVVARTVSFVAGAQETSRIQHPA